MISDDHLTAALGALDEEVAAVAQFDAARERLVSLVEMRADPDDIWEALGVVHEKLAKIKNTYDALEAHMVASGWTMETPDSLPPVLREKIEDEVPRHELHLARTSEAEVIVERWLSEQLWRHDAERFWARRAVTEDMHTRRARRRRGEG